MCSSDLAVDRCDFDDADGRKLSGPPEASAASAVQVARPAQVAQDVVETRPVCTADVEGACDFAFADGTVAVTDELQYLVRRWKGDGIVFAAHGVSWGKGVLTRRRRPSPGRCSSICPFSPSWLFP